MEIVWSKLALITYKEIFENLQFRWTKKEMRKFRDLTQSLLQKIATQQITCPVVNEKLSIRKAVVHKVVHKNVSFYYREDISAQKNLHHYLFQ
tara:strand:- start:236 stop:514 length:279 start_codon:yes stop_codon:yes gene_type:complete